MAGKCGCAGTTCSCKVTGRGAATVTGAGSSTNPYVVDVDLGLQVFDTETVDLSLLGDGSTENPYSLSANATLTFGELEDADDSVTTVGYVWARQADGTFALVPPSTAAVGAVSVGNSIEGDGSSGDVLDVRLSPLSGLVISGTGLAVDPYVISTPSDLDVLFGALPPGAFVSMDDGSAVWVKSTSGWTSVVADTGTVATTSGNITSATGFTVNSVQLRRRNGTVQFRMSITSNVNRSTANDSGNLVNVLMATIVNTAFWPVFDSPVRVLSAGSDWGMYCTTSGQIFLTNLPRTDYVWAGGEGLAVGGTWLGA